MAGQNCKNRQFAAEISHFTFSNHEQNTAIVTLTINSLATLWRAIYPARTMILPIFVLRVNPYMIVLLVVLAQIRR